MGRRSRENLGLYRRRTTQNPTTTVERGPNTPTTDPGAPSAAIVANARFTMQANDVELVTSVFSVATT